MKIKLVSIAMILALSTSLNANAFEVGDATMSIEKQEFKHGHKMKLRIGSVVREYKLRNGDITQGEIDLQKAEREAAREELQILKKAGDTEGLAAKKEELRAKRDERKAAFREYIDNHEELKAEIKEKKQEMHEKRKERRHEYRENRKKRHNEPAKV